MNKLIAVKCLNFVNSKQHKYNVDERASEFPMGTKSSAEFPALCASTSHHEPQMEDPPEDKGFFPLRFQK